MMIILFLFFQSKLGYPIVSKVMNSTFPCTLITSHNLLVVCIQESNMCQSLSPSMILNSLSLEATCL